MGEDPAGAEPLYQEASDLSGCQDAVGCPALLREDSGDEASAEALPARRGHRRRRHFHGSIGGDA